MIKKRSERMQDISLLQLIINRIGILLFNNVVTYVPSHHFRQNFMRLFGAKIGRRTSILRGAQVLDLANLRIGDSCSIGARIFFDARAGITIGDRVVIASDTQVIGGHHDFNDPSFRPIPIPVVIEDYVWIASRSTILGGSHIGRGAVVGACSMVRGRVEPLEVVAGIPAKVRSHRNPDALGYDPFYRPLFY